MSSRPLHVTFVCSGNICRSPMAEKMFAHQIEERGLAGLVRVSSAGTGSWNHTRILRDLGVPAGRIRMMRKLDPRSAAHPLDVEDPYYGSLGDYEETFAVIESSLPGLHEWVDERLAEREAAP